MTIKYRLLNSTPLSLHHIYVEPYVAPDQAYWRKQFNLVVKSIKKYELGISCLCSFHIFSNRSGTSFSFEFTDIENGYKFKTVKRSSLAQTKKDAFATCRQHITIIMPSVWPDGIRTSWWITGFKYISPPKPSYQTRIKTWFCKH